MEFMTTQSDCYHPCGYSADICTPVNGKRLRGELGQTTGAQHVRHGSADDTTHPLECTTECSAEAVLQEPSNQPGQKFLNALYNITRAAVKVNGLCQARFFVFSGGFVLERSWCKHSG
ncbi:hypothetical protein MTO96_042970 [Rhipicephalus appendiculatus]